MFTYQVSVLLIGDVRRRKLKRFRILIQLGKVIISVFLGMLLIVIFAYVILRSDMNSNAEKPSGYSVSGFNMKPNDIIFNQSNNGGPVIKVYITKENKICDMCLEEYVRGVVSAEMPADFELEALKAQAVAARTYAVVHMKQYGGTPYSKANGADVTDTVECQVYMNKEDRLNSWPEKMKGEYWNKVTQAVEETQGEIIEYNGSPITEPYYFSTSSGKTEDSEDVFSAAEPYLKSVLSPGEEIAEKYKTIKKIKYKDIITILKSKYSNIGVTADKLNGSVKILSRTAGGSVKEIKIGNITVSGVQFRSLFNLNSANFDIGYKSDYMVITCKGYGHGVGMSQWGANVMAKGGKKFDQILEHYYSGVSIKKIY